MQKSITREVEVRVETSYQGLVRGTQPPQHFFSYKIQIFNHGDTTIQLLRRRWFISDALSGQKMVEGDGVVGLQPILSPGDSHAYTSGCSLLGHFGKMVGQYIFERLDNGEIFEVQIPEFSMMHPSHLN